MSAVYSVGDTVPLAMLLEDGNESQFPQAEIYAAGGTTPLTTLDLVHKARGRYEANYLLDTAGVFTAVFITYADSGHTVENISYSREQEQLVVTQYGIDDLAIKLIRVLGLVHENAFIDNTVHDPFGQLVAARVRIFDSKEHCEAATDGGSETLGLIATYEIATTYESQGRMGTYRMKKV